MDNNRTTALIAVLGFFLMLASGGLFFCSKSKNATLSTLQVQSISNASATEPIQFSVTKDSNNNLYLGWVSEGKGFNVQKSSDYGNSWSEPTKISSNLIGAPQYSSLIAVGNYICAFGIFRGRNSYDLVNNKLQPKEHAGMAQRMSNDCGITWSDEKNVMTSNDILAGGHLVLFSMIAEEDTLYMIYRLSFRDKNDVSHVSTFFSRSYDYGLHWETPQHLNWRDPGNSGIQKYSMAVNDGAIHVLYNPSSSTGTIRHSLCYVRGRNMGNVWDPPLTLDLSRGTVSDSYSASNLISSTPNDPKIISSGGALTIAYHDWGLYYFQSTDNGESWEEQKIVSEFNVQSHSLCADNKGGTILSWIDTRLRDKKWWANLPLNQIFFMDSDPEGENNSLFYANIIDGRIGTITILTPPHSYSESVNCISAGDSNIVIWSGKQQIGEHVMNSPAPYEIFVKTLK